MSQRRLLGARGRLLPIAPGILPLLLDVGTAQRHHPAIPNYRTLCGPFLHSLGSSSRACSVAEGRGIGELRWMMRDASGRTRPNASRRPSDTNRPLVVHPCRRRLLDLAGTPAGDHGRAARNMEQGRCRGGNKPAAFPISSRPAPPIVFRIHSLSISRARDRSCSSSSYATRWRALCCGRSPGANITAAPPGRAR